ncbi:MAG: hypothetical protein K2X81_25820, partial [Candidatus Obscuribacterales bacterium]|nr:hypothetical protein [Candidatus Obscuribacterales bacterium]
MTDSVLSRAEEPPMAQLTSLVEKSTQDRAAGLSRPEHENDRALSLSTMASSASTSFRFAPLRIFRIELTQNESKIESSAVMGCLAVIAILCYVASTGFDLTFWAPVLLGVLTLIVAPLQCYRVRQKCSDRTGQVQIDKHGLALPIPQGQRYRGDQMILPWSDLISVQIGSNKKEKESADLLFFQFNSESW